MLYIVLSLWEKYANAFIWAYTLGIKVYFCKAFFPRIDCHSFIKQCHLRPLYIYNSRQFVFNKVIYDIQFINLRPVYENITTDTNMLNATE